MKCKSCKKEILLDNDPRLVVGLVNNCKCPLTRYQYLILIKLVYNKIKKYELQGPQWLGTKYQKHYKDLLEIRTKLDEVIK